MPVVFEAAPLTLRTAAPAQQQPGLRVSLDQAEAGRERASLDPGLPASPDAGFYGRDETLLALDRAFDTHRIVVLHAWAGGGKTTTAAEFARWYVLTGAAQDLLFTSFTRHLPLARLLDQIGDHYGPALARGGLDWATLTGTQRRDVALEVLGQVDWLWVCGQRRTRRRVPGRHPQHLDTARTARARRVPPRPRPAGHRDRGWDRVQGAADLPPRRAGLAG